MIFPISFLVCLPGRVTLWPINLMDPDRSDFSQQKSIDWRTVAAFYAGNFRKWSTGEISIFIIPATPSNPQQPIQQPCVKRTSNLEGCRLLVQMGFFGWELAKPWMGYDGVTCPTTTQMVVAESKIFKMIIEVLAKFQLPSGYLT